MLTVIAIEPAQRLKEGKCQVWWLPEGSKGDLQNQATKFLCVSRRDFVLMQCRLLRQQGGMELMHEMATLSGQPWQFAVLLPLSYFLSDPMLELHTFTA